VVVELFKQFQNVISFRFRSTEPRKLR